jgi:hypothetical protein
LNKKSRLAPLFWAISALILVAAACGSTPSEPAPVKPQATQDAQTSATTAPAAPASSDTAVQIESTKLRQDNGSGAAGDEVKSFKPTDHVQYFDVQLSGFLKQGSVVKWIFTAVDTTAGKDIKITEVDVNVLLGNNLTAHLSMDKDFPVGTYKADILVDGKPLGTINYTVAE